MFTSTFVNTVLAPNLQNQPSIIEHIVSFGIHIFSLNIFWFDLASALIQLLIGILLMFPFQTNVQRFGLWLSIGWALVVWIFGEGFGDLFTGSATFYAGAPGSALLYLVIAFCLLYSWHKKLPLMAGVIFLLGAVLNLMPTFWQSGMLSMLSTTPGISHMLGTFGSQGVLYGNILALDILILLGFFLIFIPNRSVAWATISFLIIVWAIGQSFGGLQSFWSGTATDPNSAPLLILFILPILVSTPGVLKIFDS
jgi:hypothetical protein